MGRRIDLENMLVEGVKEYSLTLGKQQVDDLFKFKEILVEWNSKINLTSIKDDRDIIIKHFIDSMSILPFIKGNGANIIDIGTGAGFPGIPLKIALPGVNMVLLDSLGKRVRFLDEAIGILKLKGIRAIHGRAEDFGNNQDFREKFDIAVARAVVGLPVLLEYCLPYVVPGGIFIAMKGSNTGEVEQSERALDILGGMIEEIREITLPYSDMQRNIIVIRKLRHTPTKYPRKAGKPSKAPLFQPVK